MVRKRYSSLALADLRKFFNRTQLVRDEATKLVGRFDPDKDEKLDMIEQNSAKYIDDDTYCKIPKDSGEYHLKHHGDALMNEIADKLEKENLLHADLEVDIISSNTYSVINCLSPYLHAKRNEIIQWAVENRPIPNLDKFNLNETDKFYILSYHYFKAFPHLLQERIEAEERCGMKTLKETEFTGIQVNLIDMSKLDPQNIDPFLKDILFQDHENMVKHFHPFDDFFPKNLSVKEVK